VNNAAATDDQYPYSIGASLAALDDAWLHDPKQRQRRMEDAQRENVLQCRLALAFLATWQGEMGSNTDQPESATMLVELAPLCIDRGQLTTRVDEALVTVAGALGVSSDWLYEAYRDNLNSEAV